MPEGRGNRGPAGPGTTDDSTGSGRSTAITEKVRERVSSALNARKERASEVIDDLAGSVRQVGEPLREGALAPLAGYADEAANRLGQLAAEMRGRDVSEIADDIRGLARRYPAGFAAAGFTAGLLAARFFMSTGEESTPARARASSRGTAHQGGRAGAAEQAPRGVAQPAPRTSAAHEPGDRPDMAGHRTNRRVK